MSDYALEDIGARLARAEAETASAESQLDAACRKIGMIASQGSWQPQPQEELRQAIVEYARSAARREMLRILSTQDFFIAMSRSAGSTD